MTRKVDHEKRRERIKALIKEGHGPAEIARRMNVPRIYISNQIAYMRANGIKIASFKTIAPAKKKVKIAKKAKVIKKVVAKKEKNITTSKCLCLIVPQDAINEFMKRLKS